MLAAIDAADERAVGNWQSVIPAVLPPLRAALVAAMLAVGGCGGRGGPPPQPSPSARALTPLQKTLVHACRATQAKVDFPVQCPRRWPQPVGRNRPELRPLVRSRSVYILDGQNGFGHGRRHIFHVVLAGQAEPFGTWPTGVDRRNGLADPRETDRIATVDIHRSSAIVFRAPAYPRGGVHGGHIGVAWNSGGHGYVASVHGEHLSRAAMVNAAVALARSSQPLNRP